MKIRKYLDGKKIYILDKVFIVKFSDNLKDGGHIDISTGIIEISSDISSPHEIRRILVHEIAHSMIDGFGGRETLPTVVKSKSNLRMEEYICEFFSFATCMLLKENFELMKFLSFKE
jgi:hypothetical protein